MWPVSHSFGLVFDIFGNTVTSSSSSCPNLGKKPDLTGLSITNDDTGDRDGDEDTASGYVVSFLLFF